VAVVVPTWEDVLPTVILEALSAGRPVLGTAVGGIPYMLGDDGGWTSAPDAESLAAALPKARSEAAALSDSARKRWVSHFHPDVLTARLIDVYNDFTGKSHSLPR
jgi:glycosyltransferase involved in cell wall biosynthesis